MIGRVYMIYYTMDESICYVGSTTKTLKDRFVSHKEFYSTWLLKGGNKCAISTYFQTLGIDNFKIKLLKEYEVVDKHHLRAYEQLWLSNTACVNVNNAFRIKKLSTMAFYEKNKEKRKEYSKEYYEENKDKVREYYKEYYENNKDRYASKYKNYYEENKDKVKEYQREYHRKYYEENKDRYANKNKKYYEDNKDKVKEYYENNKGKMREYYKENKDKLKDYAKEYHKKNQNKFTCVSCNFASSQRGNYTKHLESKKHSLNSATAST